MVFLRRPGFDKLGGAARRAGDDYVRGRGEVEGRQMAARAYFLVSDSSIANVNVALMLRLRAQESVPRHGVCNRKD
jgi:hypothetical protein